MRGALMKQGMGLDAGFRTRGSEVSRVEGFSDAAFAFAVTLLVISLEVPRSFEELLDVMRGLPAFAASFATLVWVWFAHYKYFRRYGLEDRVTIALNSALLFVVMFYVYPLKFLFTIVLGLFTGIRPKGTGSISSPHVDDLLIIYGLGFIAVFGLLALMNWRAHAMRAALELNELEQLITRQEIARCIGVAGVGALSVALAIPLEGGAAGIAGFVYVLIGVVEFVVGYRYGRRREALLKTQRTSDLNSTEVTTTVVH